jgi:osmotically-inducible protein OsmY
MANERSEPRRPSGRYFENEPADEFQEAYGRGGPVRSDEPERDYFFEQGAAPPERSSPQRDARRDTQRQRATRMNWRATGAQDYPGGQLGDAVSGSHRGKGPKDYRPSDERLRENVCERLTDDAFIDATDIAVTAANGEVTLSGSVETRRMKHLVEDLVAEMPGVSAVHNSIQVRRSS